jgi:hypothetical protein
MANSCRRDAVSTYPCQVIALSENVKFRLDPLPSQAGQNTPDPTPRPDAAADAAVDAEQVDEAESQMRKALGLLGETPRHRSESDRGEPSARGSDRFNGGLHRRRFVQDGDVPVTVLRRDSGHEAPAHRAVTAVPAPSTSRLQRTEGALAAETAGREKAERLLAESHAATRDLQTKIGHYELAKNEALDALRHEREAISGLRAEIEALSGRLAEAEARADAAEQVNEEHAVLLADERHARKILEKSLRAVEAARDAAKQVAARLSEAAAEPARRDPPARRHVVAEPEVTAATTRRGRASSIAVPETEPEPVKWWLVPAKTTGKRR